LHNLIRDLTDPFLFPFHAVIATLLGLLWGSFINVCIYRIPTGQKLTMPNSYCYSCGSPVRWYDNVPVLAYFWLGGRCRVCRSPFSMRYALIELLTGLLFLAIFLQYRLCWAMPTYLLFTGLLLVGTFTDFDYWIIPDRVTLGGAAMGVALALGLAFLPPVEADRWIVAHAGPIPATPFVWWGPVVNSIVGALAGAGALWSIGFIGSIVFRKPAMGLGDSKLLLAIGAFCGWKIALLSIFLGSFFGTFHGLAYLLMDLRDNRKRKAAQASEEAARSEERAERVRQLTEVLHRGDAPEGQTEANPDFTSQEQSVLTWLVSEPPAPRPVRRHLMFGPHLALAAFLLMLFEPTVMRWLGGYLGEAFPGGFDFSLLGKMFTTP
jgi:leader peptidase (prepilin peptidase)/N-methyltransferase